VTDEKIKEKFPDLVIEALTMKVTLYSPKIFSHFVENDYPMINLEKSLDLYSNIR
jgi:hypothetical protein